MRLVPEETAPKALGIIYTGLAVASAFAAPIGSYVGGIIGWRGVFWAMTPLAVVTLIWQWLSLPSMEPQTANPVGKLFWLLKRRHIAFAMAGVMLTYAGVFASFTYLRPFLESYTHVSLPQLSLLLLGLGLAGFAGTYGASALVGRHLFSLLCGLPMALAAVTIGLLAPAPLWLYMAAIERGLHVLCEKPLARTSAEARRLPDAAEAAGLVTMCSFTYRFMPVSRWRKELVSEGYLGRPSHLSLRYFAGYGRGDEYMWRFDLGEAGGGIGSDRGLWGGRSNAGRGRTARPTMPPRTRR
jgi:predicted MFS family arabinose efflux permease